MVLFQKKKEGVQVNERKRVLGDNNDNNNNFDNFFIHGLSEKRKGTVLLFVGELCNLGFLVSVLNVG